MERVHQYVTKRRDFTIDRRRNLICSASSQFRSNLLLPLLFCGMTEVAP